MLARAVVHIGNVFGAGNLAFAGSDHAFGIDVRAIEGAVAAASRDVKDRAVVVEDGDFAQLCSRWVQGDCRHRRSPAQAGFTQACGEQIVSATVVAEREHSAQIDRLDILVFTRDGVTATSPE